MTHPFSFQGSLAQYWEILFTEYKRLTATHGKPPFEFMSPSPQTINNYVPKNGDEIIIEFWDNEHKHILLVVEAELLPDEEYEKVQVIVFPQGNSFEEPVKSAILIWKEIKVVLERSNDESNLLRFKQSATSITNIIIGGDVFGSNIISGDKNQAGVENIDKKKPRKKKS